MSNGIMSLLWLLTAFGAFVAELALGVDLSIEFWSRLIISNIWSAAS